MMELPELETRTMSLCYRNNQMKKRLGMDSMLREETGQWWENIGCIINCKRSIGTRQYS